MQEEKDGSAGWPWRLKEASGGREETYCSLQSEHLRGSPRVTRPGTLRPRGEADYTGQENPAWWTVPGQIRNALLEKRGQATRSVQGRGPGSWVWGQGQQGGCGAGRRPAWSAMS